MYFECALIGIFLELNVASSSFVEFLEASMDEAVTT